MKIMLFLLLFILGCAADVSTNESVILVNESSQAEIVENIEPKEKTIDDVKEIMNKIFGKDLKYRPINSPSYTYDFDVRNDKWTYHEPMGAPFMIIEEDAETLEQFVKEFVMPTANKSKNNWTLYLNVSTIEDYDGLQADDFKMDYSLDFEKYGEHGYMHRQNIIVYKVFKGSSYNQVKHWFPAIWLGGYVQCGKNFAIDVRYDAYNGLGAFWENFDEKAFKENVEDAVRIAREDITGKMDRIIEACNQ